MEDTNIILDEIRGISPVVASIGNRQPYTVPPDYFDNLAVQLMLRIAVEEKAGADPILTISKNNVYQAPEDYFDNLAGSIMQRIKAAETGNVNEELELLSPMLGQLAKKNPFTAPDNYFSDFSDNIVAGVKAIEFVNEELENLSPLMFDLKNKQVYEVPDGYFDTTVATILDKARQQQPAKVIAIGVGRKIMRYAAAAVVTAVIAAGSWMYFKPVPATDTVAGIITKIQQSTDDEMLNYTENSTVTIAGTDADSTAVTTDDINDNDSKDLLADISDEELQKYVDQHSENPITN